MRRSVFLKKFDLTLLSCAAIFLTRFPSITLFPFSIFSFFSRTSNLARFLILVLFIVSLLNENGKLRRNKFKVLSFLVFVFFLSQSLSIVYAQNIGAFFTKYKDLILSTMLFFSLYLIVNEKNKEKIALSFVLASIFSLLFQVATYVRPNVILLYLKPFLNKNFFNFFSYQLNRGRFFGGFFDEVTFPFFLYFLLKRREARSKLFLFISISMIFFITLVSNWRSKALMLLFSVALSFFVYFKEIKRMIIPLILVLYIVLFFGNFYSLHTVGQNVIDRLIFPGYTEIRTIKSRFGYWREAYDMGVNSPLFGVGLGNYFENMAYTSKLVNINSILNFNRKFIVIDDPHNIFLSVFATTGLVGLSSLFLLILYFLYTDFFAFFKTRDFLLKSSIISFWTLFFYALFNPWMYFSYLTFFMALRGYIAALNLAKNE